MSNAGKHGGIFTGRYICKWCNHKPDGYKASSKLRDHVYKLHTEVTPEALERYIILTRKPNMDLDSIVKNYTDRLDTLTSLMDKGIFIKKYLATIGVLRDYRSDMAINTTHKYNPGLKTAEDVTRAMAEGLQGRFRKASPEVRFNGYLNRDIAVLRNAGVSEDLIPAVKTLKLIKFAKKQLEEVIKEKQDEAVEDSSGQEQPNA